MRNHPPSHSAYRRSHWTLALGCFSQFACGFTERTFGTCCVPPATAVPWTRNLGRLKLQPRMCAGLMSSLLPLISRRSPSIRVHIAALKRPHPVLKRNLSPRLSRSWFASSTVNMKPEELKHYLADQPPTVVRLEIEKHFSLLSEKQKRYAHFISKYVASLPFLLAFLRHDGAAIV